ncbi:hypothetical protein ScalyP_jg1865, partial [Parmales sp. scaly parma]
MQQELLLLLLVASLVSSQKCFIFVDMSTTDNHNLILAEVQALTSVGNVIPPTAATLSLQANSNFAPSKCVDSDITTFCATMDNSDPSIPTEWLRVDYSGTLFLGSIATVRVQNYQDSSEQYRIVGAKLYLGCIDDDDEYPTTPFGAQSSSNDYFAGTFGAATSTYNFTPNLECESECTVGHSTLLKGSFSLSDCHIQIDNSGDAIAAAFLAANPGDHVILAPGQITSGDGIDVYSRFSFANKNVDFTCSSTTIDSCVWIGDQPARVAKILWASGITTYSFLTFKSGFTIYDGGGLSIDYSDVNLVTIKFQSNFVSSVSTGGAVNVNVGNVNFYGCFFNNNRKSNGSGDTDIHRDAGTVTIFGCPAGFINSVTQDGGEDVLLSNTVSDGGSALSGASNGYAQHL